MGGYVGILFTDVGLSILVESFGGSQKRENAKSDGVKSGEQKIITAMLVRVIANTRKHLTQCVDNGGFTYLIEFSKLISKTLRIYLYYNSKIKNV